MSRSGQQHQQGNKPLEGRSRSNTLQDKHLPSHVTVEFWRDLISESESFLSGLDPKINQLWHHATHVSKHSRDDPGCQTIATRDFNLFQRSEEVRRHIYGTCLQATVAAQTPAKGKKTLTGNGVPNTDIIAASYGAYSAHVVVDDMRTDEGDMLRTKMYRDFIFAIDKQYRLFRRLSADSSCKLYWDVVLGCWAPRGDAFCVSFFPCPWIQEDALEWQPVFSKEAEIKKETLYSGANGILTHNRICQLFLRGVLVIVPTDNSDIHGCDEYRVRVMDPDYPYLDDLIFEPGQAPDIDSADVQGSSSQGKQRGRSPHPPDLDRLNTLTFRDLDRRPLSFRGSSGPNRPSIPLLFWQFVTAMVKVTWQIPPEKHSSLLPELHKRWVETWMAFQMGEHLTLGTTLAFSYLLNNPAGGSTPGPSRMSDKNNASAPLPFTFSFTTPPKPGPDAGHNFPDKILSLGCPSAFRLSELTPTTREDNIHYSSILLLCNEILQRTPHPDDVGPSAWTVGTNHQQGQQPAARRVKFQDTPYPPTAISTAPKGDDGDGGDAEPDGIVTKPHHRCDDCTAFERAVLTDVDRRGGDSDVIAFVHHHVAEPTNPEEAEKAAIGSSYTGVWDRTELLRPPQKKKGYYYAAAAAAAGGGNNKENNKNYTTEKKNAKSVYDSCGPCQRRASYVRDKRLERGLGNFSFVFSHHVPNRGSSGLDADGNLLSLGDLKLR